MAPFTSTGCAITCHASPSALSARKTAGVVQPAGRLGVVERPEPAGSGIHCTSMCHGQSPGWLSCTRSAGPQWIPSAERRASTVGARRAAARRAGVDGEHPPVSAARGARRSATRAGDSARGPPPPAWTRCAHPTSAPAARCCRGHLPVVQPELAEIGDVDQVGIRQIARGRRALPDSARPGPRPGVAAPRLEERGVLERRIPERIGRDRQVERQLERAGRAWPRSRDARPGRSRRTSRTPAAAAIERQRVGPLGDRGEHRGLGPGNVAWPSASLALPELPARSGLALFVGLVFDGTSRPSSVRHSTRAPSAARRPR